MIKITLIKDEDNKFTWEGPITNDLFFRLCNIIYYSDSVKSLGITNPKNLILKFYKLTNELLKDSNTLIKEITYNI